ncbi:unnamed protein product [Ophioblennius macclurei]
MFAVYVTALLCCLALSHSAPLACEDQLQPLDQLDLENLRGTWAMVAGMFSDETSVERYKSRDSSTIVFGNSSSPSEMPFTMTFSINGTCHYVNTIAKVEGSSFVLQGMNKTGTVLKTSCADCLLIDFDTQAKQFRRVFLFSRNREVEQKVMEDFKAQAECQNMISPEPRDPTKALCAEETVPDPAPKPEEKTDGQDA